MFAGGCPGDGRWRKVSRGVGDAAPYGLPGNGRQRKPAPHPALRGHLPQGEGKGCCWRQRKVAAGWGTPPYGWGYGNAVGFTRAAVPGAPRGRGRACPARGWRGHPSMVRPVGRGLDPSAGDCPGNGRWRKVSRGVGDAAPYGLPGNGRQRKPAPHPALRGHLPPRGKARVVVGGSGRSRRGGGTPPYGWGYGNAVGFTRAAVPGAPRGRGRACPARGLAWAPVNGSARREGS